MLTVGPFLFWPALAVLLFGSEDYQTSRLSFSVIAAVDTADEGIAIATREHLDLVVMDIRLRGEKDGIQAAREIREQVDVPIVYLTAHSDRLTVERAKATEYDGFILKPFQRRELQTTIEVAMRRRAIRARQKKE